MKATGVYWMQVFRILDTGKFELIVANAAHIKNVPGRKTDMNDAMWIADLLACGLIQANFVPNEEVQELRALTRTRKQLVREQTRHVQRIEKTLADSYYRAQFFRLQAKRWPQKAICAVAASILTAIYHILKHGTEHHDLGSAHFDRRPVVVKAGRLVEHLKKLGFTVQIQPIVEAPDAIQSAVSS